MNVRSIFFHICLMTHYFFYYSEAASNDDGEESTKRYKKWTTEEEADLIYFDVTTDTGKPKHFSRIKEMWHKNYPNSGVTDSRLRDKLRKLRMHSQEKEEYKGNFKWDEQSEQELLEVYFNTKPFKKKATIKLDEEWKRRHPDYKASRGCLLIRVGRILKENKYPDCVPQGWKRVSYDGDKGESKHCWTENEKDSLLHIHDVTNTGKRKQFDMIKVMWREKFPGSKLTDKALYNMLGRLRRATRKEGERKKFLRWTPEEEKLLLDTYLNTYPYKRDADITFKEAWKQRQESSSVPGKYIIRRAQKLIRENKYPEYIIRGRTTGSQGLTGTTSLPNDLLTTVARSDNPNTAERLDAKKFMDEGSSNRPLEEMRKESHAGTPEEGSQRWKKYLPRMESLKEILEGRNEAESGKQSGKALMVYDSDHSTSPSPTTMSEDSA